MPPQADDASSLKGSSQIRRAPAKTARVASNKVRPSARKPPRILGGRLPVGPPPPRSFHLPKSYSLPREGPGGRMPVERAGCCCGAIRPATNNTDPTNNTAGRRRFAPWVDGLFSAGSQMTLHAAITRLLVIASASLVRSFSTVSPRPENPLEQFWRCDVFCPALTSHTTSVFPRRHGAKARTSMRRLRRHHPWQSISSSSRKRCVSWGGARPFPICPFLAVPRSPPRRGRRPVGHRTGPGYSAKPATQPAGNLWVPRFLAAAWMFCTRLRPPIWLTSPSPVRLHLDTPATSRRCGAGRSRC